MDDLISRQAAIYAFGLSEKTRKYGGDHSGYDTRMLYEIQDVLEGLPSAQPEIIYCRDCKYKDDGIDEDGIPFLKCLHGRSYGGTRINDFCSWAERRSDG